VKRCLSVPLVFLTCAALASAANWPAFRGPAGDGHSPETDVPLKWSATENVRWKAPLPEAGHSSPVVWGNRVFLTQALDKGSRRAVLCFGRADGKLLWQKETPYTDNEPIHKTSTYCAATPVTDGERVIASLGSAGLVCYDFTGKQLWHKDVGKMIHLWGNASSPILYGDLAILWVGPGERQVLLAVNKTDGATVWEHAEPGGKSGLDNDPKNWIGSWSTPLIAHVSDHDELLLGVPQQLKGFDPKTGAELWSCAGLGKLVYTSPVIAADGVVVALSGFTGPALAVKAGGKGDVTAMRLWHHTQGIPQRIGSPVLAGDHLYILNEPGQAQCLDVHTGKDAGKKARVAGTTWGSMVAAAGRLYVTDQQGDTVVLAADPSLEVLARNALGEKTMATPAISDGDIFIRTHKHLWCIGPKK
jgi:outer membrane protein assembly factor BamB